MNMVEEYEKSQRRYNDLESAMPLMKRMRDAMAELDPCSKRIYNFTIYKIKRLVEEADEFLKRVEERQ